jgi:hypothetical protein
MKTFLTRGIAVSILSLSLAGSALAAGPAPAAPAVPVGPIPDRAQLSIDENVAINAACFPTRKQGQPAFNRCVQAQLVALRQHPTPDRSALSAERNRDVEYACADYQSRGIAAYNDCLTQEIGGRPASTGATD